MDVDTPVIDAHTDEIDPTGSDLPCESSHPIAFRAAHGVDRIDPAGDGPDLDRHEFRAVACQEIDLTFRKSNIAIQDVEAMLTEKPGSQSLASFAKGATSVVQMGSSEFSNSSTFTSRKVSTWT